MELELPVSLGRAPLDILIMRQVERFRFLLDPKAWKPMNA
jgi:hypothetical protein